VRVGHPQRHLQRLLAPHALIHQLGSDHVSGLRVAHVPLHCATLRLGHVARLDIKRPAVPDRRLHVVGLERHVDVRRRRVLAARARRRIPQVLVDHPVVALLFRPVVQHVGVRHRQPEPRDTSGVDPAEARTARVHEQRVVHPHKRPLDVAPSRERPAAHALRVDPGVLVGHHRLAAQEVARARLRRVDLAEVPPRAREPLDHHRLARLELRLGRLISLDHRGASSELLEGRCVGLRQALLVARGRFALFPLGTLRGVFYIHQVSGLFIAKPFQIFGRLVGLQKRGVNY
jgi:hypothetical protein